MIKKVYITRSCKDISYPVNNKYKFLFVFRFSRYLPYHQLLPNLLVLFYQFSKHDILFLHDCSQLESISINKKKCH